jgi:hypothetical protein
MFDRIKEDSEDLQSTQSPVIGDNEISNTWQNVSRAKVVGKSILIARFVPITPEISKIMSMSE